MDTGAQSAIISIESTLQFVQIVGLAQERRPQVLRRAGAGALKALGLA
jgi:hypothetical protein